MAADPEKGGVSVTVPADLPLPAPEGANFFHFTVAGDEVQLLVGSVNLLRLHEAKALGETLKIVPDITHRFLLSPMGFSTLKKQMEQIATSVSPSSVGVTVEKTKTGKVKK